MTSIRKSVYAFLSVSWVEQMRIIKEIGLNVDEFNSISPSSKMFDKLFKRLKKQKLIDKFELIMNKEKSSNENNSNKNT